MAHNEVDKNFPVTVVDIRMRFWSMTWFMVKWAIAAIPAFLILAVIAAVAVGVFSGILASFFTV